MIKENGKLGLNEEQKTTETPWAQIGKKVPKSVKRKQSGPKRGSFRACEVNTRQEK